MGDSVFHGPVNTVIQTKDLHVTVYQDGLNEQDPGTPDGCYDDSAVDQIKALHSKWGMLKTLFRMTMSHIKYGRVLLATSVIGAVFALFDVYVLRSWILYLVGILMAGIPLAYMSQKINKIYSHLRKSHGLRWRQSAPFKLIRWSEFATELRQDIPNYGVVVTELLAEFDRENRLGSAPAAKWWLVGFGILTLLCTVIWVLAIFMNERTEIFGAVAALFAATSCAFGISYIGDLVKQNRRKELIHWLEWIIADDKKAKIRRS